jgi:E1A-binding protein p400
MFSYQIRGCRFVFAIPPVTAPRLAMHVSHPSPSTYHHQQKVDFVMQRELAQPVRFLHSLTMNTAVQFPERRLIQYDCGTFAAVCYHSRHA